MIRHLAALVLAGALVAGSASAGDHYRSVHHFYHGPPVAHVSYVQPAYYVPVSQVSVYHAAVPQVYSQPSLSYSSYYAPTVPVHTASYAAPAPVRVLHHPAVTTTHVTTWPSTTLYYQPRPVSSFNTHGFLSHPDGYYRRAKIDYEIERDGDIEIDIDFDD